MGERQNAFLAINWRHPGPFFLFSVTSKSDQISNMARKTGNIHAATSSPGQKPMMNRLAGKLDRCTDHPATIPIAQKVTSSIRLRCYSLGGVFFFFGSSTHIFLA